MDVGLNNKNTLGTIDPAFADVVFFVEATDNEQLTLWQEWSKESMTNIQPLSDLDVEDIHDTILHAKIKKLNDKVKKVASTRVDWKQISNGFGLTIGQVGELPVCVSFSFAVINGKKICFYDAMSRIVDHEMIEDWLIKHFQLTHDDYCRWNHTNAMNFHNCVQGLDKLDKEPRDTVYQKN